MKISKIVLKQGDSISNKPSKSEKDNIFTMRRSIRFNKNLPEGHKISIDDICFKRPFDGLSGIEFSRIDGKVLKRSVSQFETIKFNNFLEKE